MSEPRPPHDEPQTPAGSPARAPLRVRVVEPTLGKDEPVTRPDPTRYGDWEKDGRCIDF